MHQQFMIRCFAWQSFVGSLFHIIASSVWMSCQHDSLAQRSRGFQPQPKKIDLNGMKSMSWDVFFTNKCYCISLSFLLVHLPSHSIYIDIWYDPDRYLCAWIIFRLPYHILLCLPPFADHGT